MIIPINIGSLKIKCSVSLELKEIGHLHGAVGFSYAPFAFEKDYRYSNSMQFSPNKFKLEQNKGPFMFKDV